MEDYKYTPKDFYELPPELGIPVYAYWPGQHPDYEDPLVIKVSPSIIIWLSRSLKTSSLCCSKGGSSETDHPPSPTPLTPRFSPPSFSPSVGLTPAHAGPSHPVQEVGVNTGQSLSPSPPLPLPLLAEHPHPSRSNTAPPRMYPDRGPLTSRKISPMDLVIPPYRFPTPTRPHATSSPLLEEPDTSNSQVGNLSQAAISAHSSGSQVSLSEVRTSEGPGYIPTKESRQFAGGGGFTTWYSTAGDHRLQKPPTPADVECSDLWVHSDSRDDTVQVWVYTKQSDWAVAQTGYGHPTLPTRVLWLRTPTTPSWVRRHTLTTYKGRQRKDHKLAQVPPPQ